MRAIKTLWLSAGLCLTGVLASPLSSADDTPCALQRPRAVNLDVMKPIFMRTMCVPPKNQLPGAPAVSCDVEWLRVSELISKLVADPRAQTVGTAAYMLSTTYVETGARGYDPSAREYGSKTQFDQYCELMKPKPENCPYYGRGWAQLTYYEKYSRAHDMLGLDTLHDPDLVLKPENSYEILVGGMTDGVFEVYRDDDQGGCPKGCQKPIRLGDFVNDKFVDYARARAVINANRGGSMDVMYKDLGYIPQPEHINASSVGVNAAKKFETMLCTGMGISSR